MIGYFVITLKRYNVINNYIEEPGLLLLTSQLPNSFQLESKINFQLEQNQYLALLTMATIEKIEPQPRLTCDRLN